MKTYKTSELARECKVHPNTVRLYEELGFIPPVPRAANGYRLYSQLHLEYVFLVKMVTNSTWLGGGIRKIAYSILYLAASGNFDEATHSACEHLRLVKDEREKAEFATQCVDDWASVDNQCSGSTVPSLKTKEILGKLNVSFDTIRSWERNGLITIPRDSDNGYRIYGEHEIRRLFIIRALRMARFSLMAIFRMMQRYDRGMRAGLHEMLNEQPAEEDISYHTDQWLTKIGSIEEAAGEIIHRLNVIRNLTQD